MASNFRPPTIIISLHHPFNNSSARDLQWGSQARKCVNMMQLILDNASIIVCDAIRFRRVPISCNILAIFFTCEYHGEIIANEPIILTTIIPNIHFITDYFGII